MSDAETNSTKIDEAALNKEALRLAIDIILIKSFNRRNAVDPKTVSAFKQAVPEESMRKVYLQAAAGIVFKDFWGGKKQEHELDEMSYAVA